MRTAAKSPPGAGAQTPGELVATSRDSVAAAPGESAAASVPPAAPPPSPRPVASPPAAGRALDWFNLFVANIQTGFGPFIAVYLASQRWTQTAIGLALSIGTIAAMASQVPAGAL